MTDLPDTATSPTPPPARQRRSGSRWLLAVCGAGLIVALGWLVRADLETLAVANPRVARWLGRPVPVRVEACRREELVATVGANAILEPIETVNVPTRVTGVVAAVHAELGQLVNKGDILIEMEREVPRAVFDTAEAELRNARNAVDLARLQVRRLETLLEKKIVSVSDLDEAKLRLDQAEARLSSADEAMVRDRIDLEQGTVVIAPITGIVAERFINPGESVREVHTAFLKLERIDSLLAGAAVSEEKTTEVKLGQEGELILDAFPTQIFTGPVSRIDGVVDPQSRTFKAYVRIKNDALALRPGMAGYVRLRHPKVALTIPRLAVITRAGQTGVFVVVDSRARLRSVRVRPAKLGRMEVLDGLAEGENVVYYKLINLEDNDLVEVIAPPAGARP